MIMDNGYINPPNPVNADETYFNGTSCEIDAFWQKLRCDMREFLQQNGVRVLVNANNHTMNFT